MTSSNALIALVKRRESLELKAMLPTKDDVWTIGYGHTRGVRQGDGCTAEDAEKWLREDLQIAERDVTRWVKVAISQHQFDALVSLVFNAGYPRTLIQKLNAGDIEGAANEFDRWVYQVGKALWGLCRRRAEEKLLFQGKSFTPEDVEALAEEIWAKIPLNKRHKRKA